MEINFLENENARKLFQGAAISKDLLIHISALTDVPLEAGKTIILFDEVQECPEIVTAVKFLVEEGSYRYLLSGSLLEIKSGKGYTRHAALSNVLAAENYQIPHGLVLCNENVSADGKVIYYPIYMIMFLEKEESDDMIYTPDFSILRQ